MTNPIHSVRPGVHHTTETPARPKAETRIPATPVHRSGEVSRDQVTLKSAGHPKGNADRD